jgi:RNA polymerase sigma factor (sigma-70 family)
MDEDRRLLREYVQTNSQEVFARLVERHVNLVHAVAHRAVGDRHLADDLTQAVFLLLWRNAARINPDAIIAGWLFRTTRNLSAQAVRSRRRRERHELRAARPEGTTGAAEVDWELVAPALNNAMARLKSTSRDAILLRYFEGRDYQEIGAAMGISADAAKMRVSRALEMLRNKLRRAGVGIGMPALAGGLELHAAPPAPTAAVSAAANPPAVSAVARALANHARRMIALKVSIAAVAGCGVAMGSIQAAMHSHSAPPPAQFQLAAQSAAAPIVTPAAAPSHAFAFEAIVDRAVADQLRAAGSRFPPNNNSSVLSIDRAKLATLLLADGGSHLRLLSTSPIVFPFPQTPAPGDPVAFSWTRQQTFPWGELSASVTTSGSGSIHISAVPGIGLRADIQYDFVLDATSSQRGSHSRTQSGFSLIAPGGQTLILVRGAISIANETICPINVIQLGQPAPAGSVRDWLDSSR